MKVLVIPDVHLKPYMFENASLLMKDGIADRAVCLMDIADDWNQQLNLDLYMKTYDAAIAFAKKFPETRWCYGNHDICYVWNMRETGYSFAASGIVNEKLRNLREALPDEKQLTFVHRIDRILFSHGGLSELFVRKFVQESEYSDVNRVLEKVNALGCDELWCDDSPLWLRPQYGRRRMYEPGNILQVVGHTPVEVIRKNRNIISCDVFSTYRDGESIGTSEFLLIDTVTGDFQGIPRSIVTSSETDSELKRDYEK